MLISMERRRPIAAAASVGCLLAASFFARSVARADDAYARSLQSADRTLAFIEQMTSSIEAMRRDAQANQQAMRGSCIEVHLKAARGNREVARGIRRRWDAGQDSPEYLTRSMDRLTRLHVYSMVFENEARGCATAEQVGNTLLISRAKDGVSSPSVRYAAGDLVAPPPPRLERPPFASPF